MYSPEIYSSLPISYPGVTIDPSAAESSGIERSRAESSPSYRVPYRYIRDTARAIGFRSWKTHSRRAKWLFSLVYLLVAFLPRWDRRTARRLVKRGRSQKRSFFFEPTMGEIPERLKRGPCSITRESLDDRRERRCHCRITGGELSALLG